MDQCNWGRNWTGHRSGRDNLQSPQVDRADFGRSIDLQSSVADSAAIVDQKNKGYSVCDIVAAHSLAERHDNPGWVEGASTQCSCVLVDDSDGMAFPAREIEGANTRCRKVFVLHFDERIVPFVAVKEIVHGSRRPSIL
jgi:hypothetical protein